MTQRSHSRKRNTELEPWMITVVTEAIDRGVPLKVIPGLVSVAPARFRQWYLDGLEDGASELHTAFAVAIDEHRAKAVEAGVRLMKQHAAIDWKAAHELLKVSDPETWNTAQKVHVDQNVKVQRDLSALSVEEVEQLAALEDRILTRLAADGEA